jgi:excisionase family DNA binding protein
MLLFVLEKTIKRFKILKKEESRMKEEKDKNGALKNVKWIAHYLGASRNTIHEWVTENHIPYINLGVEGGRRIIRFDMNAIDAWLLERSQAPVAKQPEETQPTESLETVSAEIE